jgi:hypothetical protein
MAPDYRIGFRCAQPVAPQTPTPVPTATPTVCGQLSGIIEQNTALLANCNYDITDKILVQENTTLTVPAGTTLHFAPGTYMRVDGRLFAEGSSSSPVTFTSLGECNTWGGVHITSKSGNQSVLRHAVIEKGRGVPDVWPYVTSLLVDNAQPTLSNILFRYNSTALSLIAGNGYTATIHSSTFVSNSHGANLFFGRNVITSSIFVGTTGSAIFACPDSTIVDNRIIGSRGLAIGLGDCSGNGPTRIYSNTIEANFDVMGGGSYNIPVEFMYNSIRDNEFVFSSFNSCQVRVEHNNIVGKSDYYNFYGSERGCTIDASGNWWGTFNRAQIAAQIFDYYDDFDYGKVIFEPYATEPFTDVGAPPP